MKIFSKKNSNQNQSNSGENAKPKKEKRKRTLGQKIAVWMWRITILLIVAFFLFFILVYNGVIGYMPSIEELKNPTSSYASVVYSANGSEMGRYYKNTGNRIYTDYKDISKYVINALVASEDARYVEHSGIDFRGLGRVIVKTVIMGQKDQGGGSTITQQLAKQLYSEPAENLMARAMQKPIEWMIALKLERFFSKEEIVNMYLNQFDFLYNAVGIQSAAQVYFNKKARNLNIQEAALLVGMVKNPSIYNPRTHPEAALERRNTVLDLMEKEGMITAAECDSIKRIPIELRFRQVKNKDGIAPYFREELRRYLTAKKPLRKNYPSWAYFSYLSDSTLWQNNPLYGWAEKNPRSDGSVYDIYKDGLRIYTTIDTAMQSYAEQAVREQLRNLQARFDKQRKGSPEYPYTINKRELSDEGRARLIQAAINQSERAVMARKRGLSQKEIDAEFNTKVPMTVFSWHGPRDTVMTPRDSVLYVKGLLRAGFLAMDPRNGYIKAYVGGADFHFFQYDMVSTGRRQIGSTMKPFLYTMAMEDGFTPQSTFSNTRPVFRLGNGGRWAPRGAGGGHIGQMVTLRFALTNSNNWISARVIDKVGPRRFANYLKNWGISTPAPAVPSLCLGPVEISLIQMVSAYTAFANYGMRSEPMFVRVITDREGNVIARFNPTQSEVISTEAHNSILSILLNVVNAGTGKRLRSNFNLRAQIGGKTGTTNHNADGWFMGFTPTIVAGAWVGGDERYIHFISTSDGQGAEMSLPIFGRFMKSVYADENLGYSEDDEFDMPEDLRPPKPAVKSGGGGGGAAVKRTGTGNAKRPAGGGGPKTGGGNAGGGESSNSSTSNATHEVTVSNDIFD